MPIEKIKLNARESARVIASFFRCRRRVKMHQRAVKISKFFPRVIPPDAHCKGSRWDEKGREEKEREEI
jgi:hypothetical protein